MDRARRGNRLTKKPKMGKPSPSMTRPPPKTPRDNKEEITGNELLGVYATGGWKGKPHSTKEGRIAAGVNYLNRFWGQKYKKKKGTPV